MKKVEKLIINGVEYSFKEKNYYTSDQGLLFKKMGDNIKGKSEYINDRLTSDTGELLNITRHQLIAQNHLGYKENLVVNHINENKTDNRADNLEWVTNHYNNIYSRRGLASQRPLFDLGQVGRIVESEKTKAIKEVLHDLQEKGYIPPMLEKMLIYEYSNNIN